MCSLSVKPIFKETYKEDWEGLKSYFVNGFYKDKKALIDNYIICKVNTKITKSAPVARNQIQKKHTQKM